MFEGADNFADIIRDGLPYYLLITLPILIICTPNPVMSSSEFPIQRMSQFDVHGVSYGCRASALNLEAKSLYTYSTSRHCIVARFQDMTIDQFREIRSKAGGLILLLPQNILLLSDDDKQHIYMLEQAMMAQEISIPVYFSTYNTELNTIIDDISTTSLSPISNDAKGTKRESALSEIFNSISANGYQVLVSGTSNSANKQSKIPIIQGELAPMKYVKSTDANGNIEAINKLPLIIITAHMNTFGLINNEINNIDVAVFMSLIDIFSKLYNTPNTAPRYRLLFLLSESGHLLNFQGMKKWLDTNVEENSQVLNADFVLCIDGIRPDSETMFMHVSKPPKEGTHMNQFFKLLKTNSQQYENISVEGVHKKINLAEVQLAWEHERFSMKRIPGFTLSNLKSHKDPLRSTQFTVADDTAALRTAKKSAKIIAETLATFMYNVNGEIFLKSMDITDDSIKPWMTMPSLFWSNDLKAAFEKYLKNVKIIYDKPDPREPDFMFYDGKEGLLNVYNVKPAVFDLFLTFAIVAYLLSVYFAIILFPDLYGAICKMSSAKLKTK